MKWAKTLFPLNKLKVRAFPCRLVLYTENGRSDTWRCITAHKRDKTALIIETQMKLRGVEFHFCPSREMEQGRAAKSAFFMFRISKATIIDWKDHYMPCSRTKLGPSQTGRPLC